MGKIAWRTLAAAHLILGFCVATVPAFAQSIEERRACAPDVMRLCREFVPNKELIDKCLMEKKSELSAACRTVVLGPETNVATPPAIPAKQPSVSPPAKPRLSTPARPRLVQQMKRKASPACDDDDDDDDDDD
jgi:hypothetical protein